MQASPAARFWEPLANRPASPADTTYRLRRPQRLAEVRVRAVRPEQFAVGTRRLSPDSLVLSQYRGGTVADVLQARSTLYIKNYGPGQLSSISVRGTSARHTAVLWQGFNINLPSLGEADFALLPAGANTGIAVQPGPSAALYGSGAMGGVVLLSTEPGWRPGLRGSVQADAGSFGLRGASLETQAATARVSVRLAASWRQATNNYTYLLQEVGGPVRYTLRHAALHHQWSLSPQVALRLGERGELTATAWLTDTYRDIQGGVRAVESQANERDQSRRLLLGYRHATRAGSQWTVRGAWFEDIINYRNQSLVSNSRVRTTQAQAEHTSALGQRASLRLGGEAQHFAALVDGYGGPVTENRGAAFALLRYDPRPALHLSANLRQALLPAGLAPLTPTLGLEWDLYSKRAAPAGADTVPGPADALHQLTLKGSAARSYRAPTLNERYWRPGGNPDLRPESGLGAEAGLRHRLPLGAGLGLETELTGFHQLIDDWVQWLPSASTGIWSPRNLRQVRSQGLEASSQLRLRRGRYALTGRASYSFTQTVKTRGTAADDDPVGRQLPYVPLHQAAFGLDQQWRGWLLGTTYTHTGYRYTEASATDFIPSFGLLGATLGYTVPSRSRAGLTLLLQATNVLNTAFDSYPSRPGPPRAFVASLRVGWQ
ncbi:TonB-dependent receptor [Hymenobacter saemangeumensis]|uniref:TonB-dependent receptor n=1 Tax=Hymenobacter saemangeumensis TaxID=1084522 RepID=A0ABP8IDE3_9BACT